MHRSGAVHVDGVRAGDISETKDGYVFTYSAEYLLDPRLRPVSLTLPKRAEPYRSATLFPFFQGLLAEGALREIQCRKLKIDESDSFGLLLKTAGVDTVGNVTVKENLDAV